TSSICCPPLLCLLSPRPAPSSTPFPYTTLFRSLIIQEFSRVDLSPARISNLQMGYLFEELVRKFNEQANEEAGDHFTPREVIRRSEEHTSELQSRFDLVCRLLLETKKPQRRRLR